MTKETKLTETQENVLGKLYDAAIHEGGWSILDNRFRSTVTALISRGYVEKRQEGSYRPKYKITQAGLDYWEGNRSPKS